MKKAMLVALVVLVAASLALAAPAQAPQGTADVLGAHLGYGRGCVMCHAPHSGARGNGAATSDTTTGNVALWGENLTPLYSQTLYFANDGTGLAVTLPSSLTGTNSHATETIVMLCLSCHDGNVAKGAMMQNMTVETLPIVGNKAPTLLGNDGSTVGNYLNDHPVGPSAIVSCGGSHNWDCSGGGNTTTAISMNGPSSSIFANTNYAFGVSLTTPLSGATVNAVACTTCHNQHSMNIYSGKVAGVTGNYTTMFFLRGYYNPTAGGNSVAQFCRQCHGGESNEMAGQTGVPTT
jgi:hypothetical protein